MSARVVTLPSGLRLRIAEAGEPGQPVVLLLHGWGASLYMWRAWFAPLAASGRRVIAVDLPGHGLSDKPEESGRYGLDSLVSIVRELLDVVAVREVDVVAQSMAGTIALELALRGEPRIRRLTLVNPARFGRVSLQRVGRLVSPPVLDLILPHLVARWVIARTHRLVYGDPAQITAQDEDEYWAPSQFPAYARAMRRLVHEFDWTRTPVKEMAARLATLAVPVLVVLGTNDRLVRGARDYVGALAAAGAALDVEIVEGAGHAVNEERAELVIPRLLAFLDAGRR